SVTKNYYRGTVGVIVLFDVTNYQSFMHAQTWINDAQDLTPPQASILLVGNKADQAAVRQVEYEQGEKLAADNGIEYIEASAKTYVKLQRYAIPSALDATERIFVGSPPNTNFSVSYSRSCSGNNVFEVFRGIVERIQDKINNGEIDASSPALGVQLRSGLPGSGGAQSATNASSDGPSFCCH
ncbi:hypothetical protein EV182_001206, partial [Spiromyces aspiralis]